MGLRDSLMGKAKSPEKSSSGAAGTPEKISEEGASSGGNGKAPEGSAAEDTEVGRPWYRTLGLSAAGPR